MAEENDTSITDTTTTDDTSVLRVLLHEIRGLSPVSTTDFVTIPAESEEFESSMSYDE